MESRVGGLPDINSLSLSSLLKVGHLLVCHFYHLSQGC